MVAKNTVITSWCGYMGHYKIVLSHLKDMSLSLSNTAFDLLDLLRLSFIHSYKEEASTHSDTIAVSLRV